MSALEIGTLAAPSILSAPHEQRVASVKRILDSGLDHVFIADHVSFHVGAGMDGLINAALLAGIDPRLKVCVGVYLLALRHPIAVARQMATLSEAAPGQLILGVGVGGEDRNEVAMMGVDPATRGKQTDECLAVLEGLASGEPFDFDGEFFQFEKAWIKPAPNPAVPILVGGRAPAALRRTARYADGWLGIWSTAERYRTTLETVDGLASELGRTPLTRHGIQIWVGIDDDRERAKARLGKAMQNFYHVPFEKFERYSPYGSVSEVADALAEFADAGCRFFNVMPVASSDEAGIDAMAEIRERLRA